MRISNVVWRREASGQFLNVVYAQEEQERDVNFYHSGHCRPPFQFVRSVPSKPGVASKLGVTLKKLGVILSCGAKPFAESVHEYFLH